MEENVLVESKKLSEMVTESLNKGEYPIIIGGDHS